VIYLHGRVAAVVAAARVMSWLWGECKQNACEIYHHLYLRTHFKAVKCFDAFRKGMS
jgi:hypothetical protein